MFGQGKSYIYNLFGTFFDKGLILIVAFIFTTYIPVNVFGEWSLFQQFIIIGAGIIIAPGMNLFSRLFYRIKDYDNGLIIKYNTVVVISILIFILVYGMYVQNLNLLLLQLLCMAVFMTYNYYSLSLRFKNRNREYFLISGSRFILFFIFGAVGIYIKGELNLVWLLYSFLISTLIIVIPVLNQFSIKNVKIENLFNDEITTLMIYGLVGTFLNSVDKFAIELKCGPWILGSYSYVVAITTASNVLVEFLKKVHVPMLFRCYSENGVRNFHFSNTLKIQLIFLFALQILLPYIIIWLLYLVRGGLNPYLDFGWLYYVIFTQGVSFALYSLYHFINPRFIYSQKTDMMIRGSLISIVIYVFMIFVLKNPSILELTLLRFQLLVFPVLFLWIKSLRIGYNER